MSVKERAGERKPIGPQTEEANKSYLDALISIEQICKGYGIGHRFVGGTLTDLLNTQTQAEIDSVGRKIFLSDYTPPQMFRSDGTVKDVDLICFPSQPSSFELAKSTLREHEKKRKRVGNFPHVSIEPARGGLFPQANPLLQVVSGIEHNGVDVWLTYDHLRAKVDPETIAPWRIILTQNGGVSFTTLNPYAHILRYAMRVPSGIKKKDKSFEFDEEGKRHNKVMLMQRLAVSVKAQAEINGANYQELFSPWIDFIIAMKHDPTLSVRLKRWATGGYWNSIGTAVAHGRGPLGPLARLGDRFTG